MDFIHEASNIAGTKVRETLGQQRVGVLTGETRFDRRTSMLKFAFTVSGSNGGKRWATYLVQDDAPAETAAFTRLRRIVAGEEPCPCGEEHAAI